QVGTIAIPSKQRDVIVNLDARNVRHVDQRQVHRHTPYHRRVPATHDHVSAIREATHVSVVITNRKSCNQTPARSFERAAITNRLAGWYPLQMTDPRM